MNKIKDLNVIDFRVGFLNDHILVHKETLKMRRRGQTRSRNDEVHTWSRPSKNLYILESGGGSSWLSLRRRNVSGVPCTYVSFQIFVTRSPRKEGLEDYDLTCEVQDPLCVSGVVGPEWVKTEVKDPYRDNV